MDKITELMQALQTLVEERDIAIAAVEGLRAERDDARKQLREKGAELGVAEGDLQRALAECKALTRSVDLERRANLARQIASLHEEIHRYRVKVVNYDHVAAEKEKALASLEDANQRIDKYCTELGEVRRALEESQKWESRYRVMEARLKGALFGVEEPVDGNGLCIGCAFWTEESKGGICDMCRRGEHGSQYTPQPLEKGEGRLCEDCEHNAGAEDAPVIGFNAICIGCRGTTTKPHWTKKIPKAADLDPSDTEHFKLEARCECGHVGNFGAFEGTKCLTCASKPNS